MKNHIKKSLLEALRKLRKDFDEFRGIEGQRESIALAISDIIAKLSSVPITDEE